MTVNNTYKKSQDSTQSAKSIQEQKFIIVDASGLVVGRLAAKIASILRGKEKTNFTPHSITGDFVIVINAEKVKFTAKKFKTKKYWRHTGFPGGIKCLTPYQLSIKGQSSEIIMKAVDGMLPSGPLGREMLRNLRVYNSAEHHHDAQNPTILNVGNLNRKNIAN